MGFSVPPEGNADGSRTPESQTPESKDAGRLREIERRRDALLAEARGERTQDDGGSGARLAGLGVQFTVALLLFLYLGNTVDHRFGTAPWGLIGGLCVGFGSGMYLMMRALRDENRRDDERKKTGKGS
jgi:ATP synthase protein I